jgi:hypothetical protein
MLKAILLAVALPALFLLTAGHARAERSCYTTGATQFVDSIEYCVSSSLPPHGALTYGPDNMTDARGTTAWCEGVDGRGEGQTIELTINRGAKFRRLLVQNGYSKSDQAFHNNGRIKTLEVATDTGSKITATLADTHDMAIIDLPAPDNYRRLIVTILDVYPGEKYADTCVDYLTPDFEYEETLAPSPGTDKAPLPAPEKPAEHPSEPATPPKTPDPFGDLGFPGERDLKLKDK